MRFSFISKSAGLLVLAVGLNVTFIASSAFSQSVMGQGTPSGSSTGSGQGNALTGGAEGAPTDQATPSSTTGQMPSGTSSGPSPDSKDKGMYPSPNTQPSR